MVAPAELVAKRRVRAIKTIGPDGTLQAMAAGAMGTEEMRCGLFEAVRRGLAADVTRLLDAGAPMESSRRVRAVAMRRGRPAVRGALGWARFRQLLTCGGALRWGVAEQGLGAWSGCQGREPGRGCATAGPRSRPGCHGPGRPRYCVCDRGAAGAVASAGHVRRGGCRLPSRTAAFFARPPTRKAHSK